MLSLVRRVGARLPAVPRLEIRLSASQSLVILLVALASLVWANSALMQAHRALWRTALRVRVSGLGGEGDLRFLVNDGLMTFFFLAAGIAIRSAARSQQNSDLGRSRLLWAIAIGGGIASAFVGAGLMRMVQLPTYEHPRMVTDLVLASVVLSLSRLAQPRILIPMVAAIALLDELAADVMLAIRGAPSTAPEGLAVVCFGVAILLAIREYEFQSRWLYLILMVGIWIGTNLAGFNPAMAGAMVGLLANERAWLPMKQPRKLWARGLSRRKSLVGAGIAIAYVAANAGVDIPYRDLTPGSTGTLIFQGLLLGLAKLVGVIVCAWIAVRLGQATLPEGVKWRHIALVGASAGVGLTTSLALADRALAPAASAGMGQLCVLGESSVAVLMTLIFGWAMSMPNLRIRLRAIERSVPAGESGYGIAE